MKNISIIGGDLRIVHLTNLLRKDGYCVYTYGLEKAKELMEDEKIDSLEIAVKKSDIIISSVPLSKDGKFVNAPYSKNDIKIQDLVYGLAGKKFIAGKILREMKENKNFECYDLLDFEEYAILNCIATAEGAIQVAMENYPKTLSGSNILILGFGRIGKILSKMLQGIGANVYCEARKNTDLAYIRGYGYNPINLKNLNENLDKYDIIINNVPKMILDKERLDLVKKDVFIIDLASVPGGVDFEYAQNKNIKTIWALGLPGKVAPISSAMYIKDVLYNII